MSINEMEARMKAICAEHDFTGISAELNTLLGFQSFAHWRGFARSGIPCVHSGYYPNIEDAFAAAIKKVREDREPYETVDEKAAAIERLKKQLAKLEGENEE